MAQPPKVSKEGMARGRRAKRNGLNPVLITLAKMRRAKREKDAKAERDRQNNIGKMEKANQKKINKLEQINSAIEKEIELIRKHPSKLGVMRLCVIVESKFANYENRIAAANFLLDLSRIELNEPVPDE